MWVRRGKHFCCTLYFFSYINIDIDVHLSYFSNHDVTLVNGVSQLADTSESLRNSSKNSLHDELTPTPELLVPGSTKKSSSFTPRRKQQEGDSIVLPKINVKESFTSTKSKSSKKKLGKVRRHRNIDSSRSSGVVHFVADYRPVDDESYKERKSYWWNDNLPYVGKKVDPGRKCSSLTTRSADCVNYQDKKRCLVTRHLGKANGDLMRDLLNNRGEIAAKESIQCLMKLFISDQTMKSDEAQSCTKVETSKTVDEISKSLRTGKRKTLKDIGQELKINGISSANENKRTERFSMYKGSSNGGERRNMNIPVRCALPLSKDTVLLGAPYRTEEEHEVLINSMPNR